jgi:hypothetical protein
MASNGGHGVAWPRAERSLEQEREYLLERPAYRDREGKVLVS